MCSFEILDLIFPFVLPCLTSLGSLYYTSLSYCFCINGLLSKSSLFLPFFLILDLVGNVLPSKVILVGVTEKRRWKSQWCSVCLIKEDECDSKQTSIKTASRDWREEYTLKSLPPSLVEHTEHSKCSHKEKKKTIIIEKEPEIVILSERPVLLLRKEVLSCCSFHAEFILLERDLEGYKGLGL